MTEVIFIELLINLSLNSVAGSTLACKPQV